jgi:hypothetical protein
VSGRRGESIGLHNPGQANRMVSVPVGPGIQVRELINESEAFMFSKLRFVLLACFITAVPIPISFSKPPAASRIQDAAASPSTEIKGSDFKIIQIAFDHFRKLKHKEFTAERKKIENYTFSIQKRGTVIEVEFMPRSDPNSREIGAYTTYGVCIIYDIDSSSFKVVKWMLGA